MTSNPWVDIPTAIRGQLSRRRVDAELDLALFWFRDEVGRLGLLIEISRQISVSVLKEAKINIRDLSVDVVDIAEERLRALVVRLEDSQNQDVFLKLCLDLIEHIRSSDEGQDIFQIVCTRLKKWQSLLSGKVKNLLSKIEIQGLYAELYFITEMLKRNGCPENLLIRGWEGPEKTQHDFILNDMAVEIKSIAGNQRRKVRISSEDQLDTHLNRLYLQVYFLYEVHDDTRGESLNAIVKRINGQLTNSANRELFESRLVAARYIDIPDYDLPIFRIEDTSIYLVSEGFPRITRKLIPNGIEAVAYDLVLAEIENFRTDTIEFKG